MGGGGGRWICTVSRQQPRRSLPGEHAVHLPPSPPLPSLRSNALAYVQGLLRDRDFEPFRQPVRGVAGYSDVVRRPMDLGTIKGELLLLVIVVMFIAFYCYCFGFIVIVIIIARQH